MPYTARHLLAEAQKTSQILRGEGDGERNRVFAAAWEAQAQVPAHSSGPRDPRYPAQDRGRRGARPRCDCYRRPVVAVAVVNRSGWLEVSVPTLWPSAWHRAAISCSVKVGGISVGVHAARTPTKATNPMRLIMTLRAQAPPIAVLPRYRETESRVCCFTSPALAVWPVGQAPRTWPGNPKLQISDNERNSNAVRWWWGGRCKRGRAKQGGPGMLSGATLAAVCLKGGRNEDCYDRFVRCGFSRRHCYLAKPTCANPGGRSLRHRVFRQG